MGSLTLVAGDWSRRKETEFKSVKLHLKDVLVSHPVYVNGLGKYILSIKFHFENRKIRKKQQQNI